MRRPRPNPEAGFSMVEMLMTAFVLAVGILGLTMLQVMSLKTSRGGRSLTSAVQLGDRVMDQIEMEGRLTWLNKTDTQYTVPDTPSGLKYINGGAPSQTFDIQGLPVLATDPNKFFTVTTARLVTVVGAAPSGQIHDFTVRVDFSDAVDSTQAAIPRSVTLTRRILHG